MYKRLLVWLLVLSIVNVSCDHNQQTGGPVVYPGSWPIKGLKAPTGSTSAPLEVLKSIIHEPLVTFSDDNCVSVGDDRIGPRYWAIGFHYAGEWQSAVQEIMNNLSQYDIKILDEQSPATTSDSSNNWYIKLSVSNDEGEVYLLNMFNWVKEGRYFWSIQLSEPEWPADR